VNSSELAIFAVEGRSNLQVLWGLLIVAAIGVVGLSILCAISLAKLRAGRRREARLARAIDAKSDEIARLEARLIEYIEMEEGVEELKTEVRRADAIRGKSEQRLRDQNAEIEKVKAEARSRMAELERLRKIVEHVDGL
jgi:septal ring factor EnvC (AmiA/AmiB activator)